MKNHAALAKSYTGGGGIAQKGAQTFGGPAANGSKPGEDADARRKAAMESQPFKSQVDPMPHVSLGGHGQTATARGRGPAMGG